MRKETQNRRNVSRKLANNLDFNLTIQATHDARRRFDDKSQVRQACPFFFFLLSRLLSKKVSARRQREKERQRGGGKGEVIRCATVASDTLSDKEGFSRSREAGSAGERGGWRAKNSAKKSRAILWRGICTVHSGKSWEAISQLDGLVCHDELQQLWQDELRAIPVCV